MKFEDALKIFEEAEKRIKEDEIKHIIGYGDFLLERFEKEGGIDGLIYLLGLLIFSLKMADKEDMKTLTGILIDYVTMKVAIKVKDRLDELRNFIMKSS